jgi:(E)-4-hydroxy-3-methylbut-2-enyl-diphosphate synthase
MAGKRSARSTKPDGKPVTRDRTRRIMAGKLAIGGGAPVSVQSMTKTPTRDVRATVAQVLELEKAGCELVRVACPEEADARAIKEIRRNINLPLCADIHFDHRLALIALEGGVDKLRINPGNIGGPDRVKAVVREAKARKVPIRVGVNSGSIEKRLLAKYGGRSATAMVESALDHVKLLEDEGFTDIVVSLKASDVPGTLSAYRLFARRSRYPLHLGVTESGSPRAGTVKSAMGIGVLLLEGIGDTIRVSLSAPPTEEVRVGWEILRSAGLRERGPVIVSCPTCGRTEFDMLSKLAEVERRLAHLTVPMTVAVMGCEVNGPGEAKHADVGIAGGGDRAALFRRGKLVRVVPFAEFVDAIVGEAERLAREIKGDKAR